MKGKLTDARLLQLLGEMKDISGVEYALCAIDGKVIAATFESDKSKMGESAKRFISSMAESQVMGGRVFLRIETEGEEYALICEKDGGIESTYVLGRMAASQIRNICLITSEPFNRISFVRSLLCGEIRGAQVSEMQNKLRLKDGAYMIYVIRFAPERREAVLETLKELFVSRQADCLAETESGAAVLIKDAGDIEERNYGHYANVILDNLRTEAMINVRVGYGCEVDSYEKMPQVYREICKVLKIGEIFYGERNVFCCDDMGMARLIYALPKEACVTFLSETLGEHWMEELNEEDKRVVMSLFENNLNISETARRLFIHRNTLVYRLDRIERQIGLDIRGFEDAMTYKIAMMLKTHVAAMREG